jgi:hypothetical protein
LLSCIGSLLLCDFNLQTQFCLPGIQGVKNLGQLSVNCCRTMAVTLHIFKVKGYYYTSLKKLGEENRTKSYYGCPVLVEILLANPIFDCFVPTYSVKGLDGIRSSPTTASLQIDV